MFRNRKYRPGTGLSSSRSTANTTSSSIASLHPQVTSTPLANPKRAIENAEQNVNVVVSTSSQSKESAADEFAEIPASQFIMPSRYISQRSVRLQSQLSMTQSTPSSYFESVLRKSGVQLTARDSDSSYTLKGDHLKFVRNLRKELKSHQKYPENVKSFLKGLNEAMRNPTQMIKLLSGCIIILPDSERSKISQESLMTDLLMIDFLQTEIIDIILTKVKSLASEGHGCSSQMNIELLLTQLKFIDHLTNGEVVCEQIFDILENASSESRTIVIKNLADIIDLTKHNEVVTNLMSILPDDQLLTISAIDTFGNMCLNPDVYEKICKKIVRFMKSDAQMQSLPCYTRFVLRFDHTDIEKLSAIIKELRICLKWPESEAVTTKILIQKNQKEVFNCIHVSLIGSKQLFNVWLKRIQTDVAVAKGIDLIILFMMMTINDERSNYIENIIRRKIRIESIQLKTLEEAAKLYPTILMEYSKVFFELIQTFAKDRTSEIAYFGSVAYRIAFGIENCDRKMLLSKLVAFVCERHAQSVHDMEKTTAFVSNTSAQSDTTTSALMILTEINQKYPTEMQRNGLQILRILDVCNELKLSQYRLVMNILCSMAYSHPPCEMLKEHIDLLVKKQVSSSIQNVRTLGIIGVVRVIERLVWQRQVSSQNELNTSFQTIEELPTEDARIAANYIELLLTSVQNSVNHLILGLDELSLVFSQRMKLIGNSEEHFNASFLIWLGDMLTNNFLENFIVSGLPKDNEKTKFCAMHMLNTLDEIKSTEEPPIAVNIGEGILKTSPNSLANIRVLPALLKIMRIIFALRTSGSLNTINAILGASVIWPDIMDSDKTIDIFDELNDDFARQVLDAYFHTVNFWRECVSAFVTQDDELIKTRVLTRLSQLIELEEKIKQIMETAPDDYIPPACTFMNEHSANKKMFKKPVVPAKRGRKRKPNEDNIENTIENHNEIENSGIAQRKRTSGVNGNQNDYFRSMDPQILILFENSLSTEYPLPKQQIGQILGLLDFRFLMEDFIKKVESIHGIHKYTSGNCSEENILFPEAYLSDVIELLPKIAHFQDQLIVKLKTFMTKTSDHTFCDPFNEHNNYIKCCFGLCLKLLATLFTWPGFDEEGNEELLNGALKAITGGKIDKIATISNRAKASLKKITKNVNLVSKLETAVFMLDLTKSLTKYIQEDNIHNEIIVPMCEKFLSKVWYGNDGNEVRGTDCNANLEKLLQSFFKLAKMSFLTKHLTWIVDEAKELKSKKSLKTFPCFKIANFSYLYRTIYTALIDELQRKLDKATSISENHLTIWENACTTVNMLLTIAKSIDQSRIFNIYLKNTHTFIKLFLQHGTILIETLIRRNCERVLNLIKNLQNSTRFLHTLCCHSKEIKIASIIAQIPALRETNSQLVYKIKAALAANNCSEAFWMGNLKNKNLYGEDILSQTSSMTRTTTSDEEEDTSRENGENVNENSIQEPSTSKASKTRPRKKRKLNTRESLDSYDDDNSNQSEHSRSRCF